MKFIEAFKAMKEGHKVKLPSWAGYWVYDPDGDRIWMHCKDGRVLEIRETEVLSYTLENICSDEWVIDDGANAPVLGGIAGEIVNVDHCNIGNKALAFVGTSGVQMGWLASQADMLADDWVFQNEEEGAKKEFPNIPLEEFTIKIDPPKNRT